MLIEFSITNFRSLATRQTLSMACSTLKEPQDLSQNRFALPGPGNLGLLRSTAIYGPNAGGKSNLLSAMSAMREVVVESATEWQRGDLLPLTPYLLDPQSAKAPSEFEVIFIADGVRYQYGFAATRTRVVEEWLVAYPKGRAQRWFDRQWDKKADTYQWQIGNALQGQKQLWQDSTRDNALFLSTAVHLNSKQLQPVYDWFHKILRTATVAGWSRGFTASLCEKADHKARVLAFLKAADMAIDDIVVEKKAFDRDDLPDEMPDEIKDVVSKNMSGKQVIVRLNTVHQGTDGNPVAFDFDEESDGTQTLFSFAGQWLDTLENGYVLFIDELHDNLHPKLVQFLVKLFHSDKTNPNNAQLVFTTHETSILNQHIFRRDQVWFCEKEDHRSTVLFPLTDFSPRKGRENLEAAYLSGRFGALPYIRELQAGK